MAYSPKRPVSCTVVSRPGWPTLIAIQHPQHLLVVPVRVLQRAVGVEGERSHAVLERALLDLRPYAVELLAFDAAVVPDVAGFGEDDGVFEVGELLLNVQDGGGGEAVELVAAGALDRVDHREAAAEAEGALGGEGAGPDVLGDLYLF